MGRDSKNNKKKRDLSQDPEESEKRRKTESPTHSLKIKGPPRVTRCFERLHEPISLSDLSSLLQYAAFGKSVTTQPSWSHLHHQQKLSGVNVTVLEDVTLAHFYRFYPQFKNLRRRYKTRCTLVACDGDVSTLLLNSKLSSRTAAAPSGPEPSGTPLPSSTPLPKTPTRLKDNDLRWHPVISKFGCETRGLSAYVLTRDEMSRKNFPLLGAPGCKSFVCTEKNGPVTDNSPLYGIDCEMCYTRAGLEVTRVSLVDGQGQCMMDELVKPDIPILNYMTRFSGITKHMLQPITTRLCDVQSKLIQLLPQDAVLVGHSLDCDLRVLQLIHPNVIDTSLLYRGECGRRFKLKLLAKLMLDMDIQCEERTGHDPTEDALAAVKLAQYFINTGPRQVVELHKVLWGLDISSPPPHVNGSSHKTLSVTRLLDTMNSGTSSTPASNLTFSHALYKTGQPALQLGRLAGNNGQPTNKLWRTQGCSSDKKVVEALRRQVASHPLCLLELSAYSQLITHTQPSYTQRNLHKMVSGLREMCVVYIGPLWADCNERDVKKLCSSCGAVRSVRLLTSTHRLYALVEFEFLEGAVLALERLDGEPMYGFTLKVQRPVGELTLDLEQYLDDLRSDPVNESVVYAANVANDDQMANLQLTLEPHLGRVEGVTIRPQATRKKKRRRRHAFIKLDTAVTELALDHWAQLSPEQVRLWQALTPPHLSTWAPDGTSDGTWDGTSDGTMDGSMNGHSNEETPIPEGCGEVRNGEKDGGEVNGGEEESGGQERGEREESGGGGGREEGGQDEDGTVEEVEAEVDRKTAGVMRKLDVRVGKILEALPDNTLSVVILPGQHSVGGVSYPGLCFMEVKQEAASSSSD
ncbi:RNA exonuclease 5-like [Engraulis encrasicolus]|uniref:RNA exonuclease 5-like n=1 Tax=Engraulis encrasicolus TaxID=184585 RepID=UPI002FD1EB41